MIAFERPQVDLLVSRLLEPPKSLLVVSGPRQTGKTTIVSQALARLDMENRYISVDEPELAEPGLALDRNVRPSNVRDHEWLARVWEDARRAASKSDRGFVLVLDEIQKILQWSEAVKGLWDSDRKNRVPLHVVILGSAPLLMQQGLTESLAGRFELIRVTHWSLREMVDAFGFDLSQYIYFGGYPGAAHLVNDQPRWREYIRSSLIEPNIERDILSMTRVNKPTLLKRAFELGSSYSGQILSYNKMQGQLQDAGNTTTLAHYLDLLSKSGLLTGLQKYAGQQQSAQGVQPKAECSKHLVYGG